MVIMRVLRGSFAQYPQGIINLYMHNDREGYASSSAVFPGKVELFFSYQGVTRGWRILSSDWAI